MFELILLIHTFKGLNNISIEMSKMSHSHDKYQLTPLISTKSTEKKIM